MAVFGSIGPCFRPFDNLEVDVNSIVAAGSRINAQHFLGLAGFKLADGNLAAVWEGDCQCLIYHLAFMVYLVCLTMRELADLMTEGRWFFDAPSIILIFLNEALLFLLLMLRIFLLW